MTEAELAYQLSEIIDRTWSMQQWWASISFGVLIIAHVASDRLNLLLVAIILGLYAAFTFYMGNILQIQLGEMAAIFLDIEALIESGATSSALSNHYAKQFVGDSISSYWSFVLSFGGTFACVNVYLIYSYVKARS